MYVQLWLQLFTQQTLNEYLKQKKTHLFLYHLSQSLAPRWPELGLESTHVCTPSHSSTVEAVDHDNNAKQ